MIDAGYWKLPENITKWFAKLTGAKEPKNMYVHIDLPWGDLVNLTEPVKTMLNALSPMALPLQLGLNSKSFPRTWNTYRKVPRRTSTCPLASYLVPNWSLAPPWNPAYEG